MRALIVDPPAYTPPYDHALAGAVARAGAEVELVTSRFPHGEVPRSEGYEVRELFYRRSAGLGPRTRRFARLAEHLPGMRRLGRVARDADVVHYQWLPLPGLDRRLLPRARPRLYTMHWRLPDASSRIGRSLSALLAAMDGVVVHSEHGRERLTRDFGVPPEALEVIPHGAFDYLTTLPDAEPLPPELAEVTAPVVLAFGLVRPYKGTDVLLRAFARAGSDAELWIVGMPRMDMEPLRELARAAPGRVRFIDRFVPDREIPAFMRRADLVALPYRNIEQSGVLYTAIAFGRPMVLSDVGGFPEVARTGAAELVPPGDDAALAAALERLLGDPAVRERMSAAAERAAAGEYGWDRIGERTVAFYERLLGREGAL